MAQMLSLLVVGIASMAPHAAALKVHESLPKSGSQDLVFMHIPHSFGTTIEMHQALPVNFIEKEFQLQFEGHLHGLESSVRETEIARLALMAEVYGEPHVAWGHFNLALNTTSAVGCPMYSTPTKYWPYNLSYAYFNNQTAFGVLRDPYERLVEMFRGDFQGYGSFNKTFEESCDVNGAVKALMNKFSTEGIPYTSECAFRPQGDYFGGEHGITLPIDGRRFPTSMNEVFEKHGYEQRINTSHVLYPTGCDVWAGDLDDDTKALVRKVYSGDFALICAYFNHCEENENVCIREIKGNYCGNETSQ